MNKRRKLFSSASVTSKRRRLFSNLNEGGASNNTFQGGELTKKVQCRDCGYIMMTSASTTSLRCPKCGSSNRFNVLTISPSPDNSPEAVEVEISKIKEVNKNNDPLVKNEKTFTRRSLFNKVDDQEFQREFSEISNKFEENLKMYSGKVLKKEQVERIFSEPSESLVEKGFAKLTENGELKINDSAFFQSKLFSKLIVSVTKVLDLDPEVTLGNCPKEDIINSLESKSVIPNRGIILIKKAHALPVEREIEFSDKESESWIEDSGIIGDLQLEFGGSKMSVKEFTDLLNERYNDAPENIIDLLISKGVIKIQGNQVDIYK